MKRPIPVVLTAILLGVLAAPQLVAADGILLFLVSFVAPHKGIASLPPGPTPFAPSFLLILFFAIAIFHAALAVWFIWTLVGLVRLRPWARYSTLVIAGRTTFFCGIGTLTYFAMPFLARNLPTQTPAPNPHMMQGAFIFFGAVSFIFAVLGIVLLVYYNLASTRAVFLHNAPINLDPPNTSTGRPRPTAITVIGWLYLVSALPCLVYIFLPYPAFLLGFILTGVAAHLIYALIVAWGLAIGYGLLRLHNWARLAVYWMALIGLLQFAILLTPWGARQFRICMDSVYAASQWYFGIATPPQNFASSSVAVAFLTLLTCVFLGVILWFLHRHRAAFTPLPPPPPLPPSIEPEPQAAT